MARYNYANNPNILPATILPQASPNYHLEALADSIQSGKDIVKEQQRKIDMANKLGEPYQFDTKDILSNFLPELQTANNDMLNKDVNYRMKGVNWLDPTHPQEYGEQLKGYATLDNTIQSARAITKTFYDAQKALIDPQGAKAYDNPQSMARLGEMSNAKSLKDAQAVYDKYGGQLLVQRNPLDQAAWDKNFESMIDNIPAGSRFADNKNAVQEANTNIDDVLKIFEDPKVKADYMKQGGNEEGWNAMVAKYKPQLEGKRYVFKPKVFAPKSPTGGGAVDEEYLTRTDELIQLIQKQDQAAVGSIVGAAWDDNKIADADYKVINGKTHLVLKLTGANKKQAVWDKDYDDADKSPDLTVHKKGDPRYLTGGNGYPTASPMMEDAPAKEETIDLTNPSNYNKILNLLNTVPGRKKIGIEELNALTKKQGATTTTGAGLPVMKPKTTQNGLPIIQ